MKNQTTAIALWALGIFSAAHFTSCKKESTSNTTPAKSKEELLVDKQWHPKFGGGVYEVFKSDGKFYNRVVYNNWKWINDSDSILIEDYRGDSVTTFVIDWVKEDEMSMYRDNKSTLELYKTKIWF